MPHTHITSEKTPCKIVEYSGTGLAPNDLSRHLQDVSSSMFNSITNYKN